MDTEDVSVVATLLGLMLAHPLPLELLPPLCSVLPNLASFFRRCSCVSRVGKIPWNARGLTPMVLAMAVSTRAECHRCQVSSAGAPQTTFVFIDFYKPRVIGR